MNEQLIVFCLPGSEQFFSRLATRFAIETGNATIRQFPDGETYVRVHSDLKNKKVVLVCSLYQPDSKFFALYFLAKTAKELGAASVHLIAPYLGYMRQDTQFNPGEGITSQYFGSLLSGFIDSISTIDPHLHRYNSLSEIYFVPDFVLHAAGLIAGWVKENIQNPVLIGPDSESKQWVADIAGIAGVPYLVLHKIRKGDREVAVSVPEVEKYRSFTPVLVDDIISTARTMIETVGHLLNAGMPAPVCIGVHAVFAGTAYPDLLNAGAAKVITTNTIPHESNGIDVSSVFSATLEF